MSETTISVSIDVPSLADGIAFYGQAFGFEVSVRPAPGVAVSGVNVATGPDDVVELRRTDAEVARNWRAATRNAFRTAFDAGLHADLVTADGWYRFRPTEQGS